MSNSTPHLPPGFRFHPTDEELILHYLRNRAASSPCPASIIAEVDIYKFDPWDLPARAMFGEREWYFFTPRDRKYPNGARPNRAASSGYWKATGTDKPITSTATKGNENIGVKKALVFYRGKPPKGIKTNWIMHEYRLSESLTKNNNRPFKSSMRLDDWVLCRIYQKSSHLQEDSTAGSGRRQDSTNSSQQSSLNLPKSFSLTNLFAEADFSLLSRLLETPVETPDMLNQSFMNSSSAGGSYLLNQFSETESSVSHADDGLKRRRLEEEGGSQFHSSKKSKGSWNYTDLGSQFDEQDFSNQQWLLNSHLGLQ